MPLFGHLALHYLLGAWAAWCARGAPALHARLAAWPLAGAAGLAAAFLVPCATYQFRFYPDFVLGYAADPRLYPQLMAHVGALSALAMCANLAALVGGYAAMRYGLCHRHRLSLMWAPGAVGLALVATYICLGARPWYVGTYAAFWAGEATPWHRCAHAWVTTLAYIGCAALPKYIAAKVHAARASGA